MITATFSLPSPSALWPSSSHTKAEIKEGVKAKKAQIQRSSHSVHSVLKLTHKHKSQCNFVSLTWRNASNHLLFQSKIPSHQLSAHHQVVVAVPNPNVSCEEQQLCKMDEDPASRMEQGRRTPRGSQLAEDATVNGGGGSSSLTICSTDLIEEGKHATSSSHISATTSTPQVSQASSSVEGCRVRVSRERAWR